MRKLCAFIVQTVDGYYEGPNGEFDWPNVQQELHGHFVDVRSLAAEAVPA